MKIKISKGKTFDKDVFELISNSDLEYVALVALSKVLEDCEYGGFSVLSPQGIHPYGEPTMNYTIHLSSGFIHYMFGKLLTDKWINMPYIKKLQTMDSL